MPVLLPMIPVLAITVPVNATRLKVLGILM
jgi:hypothetical protein